jgi:hypothetical protein
MRGEKREKERVRPLCERERDRERAIRVEGEKLTRTVR